MEFVNLAPILYPERHRDDSSNGWSYPHRLHGGVWQRWPWPHAVGWRIKWRPIPRDIVGLAGDLCSRTLERVTYQMIGTYCIAPPTLYLQRTAQQDQNPITVSSNNNTPHSIIWTLHTTTTATYIMALSHEQSRHDCSNSDGTRKVKVKIMKWVSESIHSCRQQYINGMGIHTDCGHLT